MDAAENKILRDFIKRTHGEAKLEEILEVSKRAKQAEKERKESGLAKRFNVPANLNPAPGSFPLALSRELNGPAVRGEAPNCGIHNTIQSYHFERPELSKLHALLKNVGAGLIARALRPRGQSRDSKTGAIRHNDIIVADTPVSFDQSGKRILPTPLSLPSLDLAIDLILKSSSLPINQVGGISKLEVTINDKKWTETPSQSVTKDVPPQISVSQMSQKIPIYVKAVINKLQIDCIVKNVRNSPDGIQVFFVNYASATALTDHLGQFILCDSGNDIYDDDIYGSESPCKCNFFLQINYITSEVIWFATDPQDPQDESFATLRESDKEAKTWALGCGQHNGKGGVLYENTVRLIPYAPQSAEAQALIGAPDVFDKWFERCIPVAFKTCPTGPIEANMIGDVKDWTAREFGLVVVNFVGHIFEHLGKNVQKDCAVPDQIKSVFFGAPFVAGQDFNYDKGVVGSNAKFYTVLDVAI